ncbi:hypothetical protein HDU96_003381, partial [Phlyctochytrium bullatum]
MQQAYRAATRTPPRRRAPLQSLDPNIRVEPSTVAAPHALPRQTSQDAAVTLQQHGLGVPHTSLESVSQGPDPPGQELGIEDASLDPTPPPLDTLPDLSQEIEDA